MDISKKAGMKRLFGSEYRCLDKLIICGISLLVIIYQQNLSINYSHDAKFVKHKAMVQANSAIFNKDMTVEEKLIINGGI